MTVSTAGRLVVREIDPLEAPASVVDAWSDLERRALEPNAYSSPHFVIPAVRHLDRDGGVVVLGVERAPERSDASPSLAAVMVGRTVAASRDFPLPHLRVYASRHSFLNGILLDRQDGAAALDTLLAYVEDQPKRWHGLEINDTWGDGQAYDLLAAATERRGIATHLWNERRRAVLRPHDDRARIEASEAAEARALSRRVRRLAERGEASLRLVCQGGIPDASVEAFLALEHDGWKGDRGSSLRSTPCCERFFREMVARFGAEERAVFVEVQLDGNVVASTANFISGYAGFAFKIGWQRALAKLSPARLAELELVRQLFRADPLTALAFLDSGSPEGAYIESLWPGRRPLVSLGLGTTALGRAVIRAMRAARRVWRRYRTACGGDGERPEPG
ncbi:MAG TPA: GNAT family N-acetyltransferase [Polyangia bacterium]|nr:GNAT family N-acetyltransferase [Polyangia bacterium]